jgi:hypothetical protein
VPLGQTEEPVGLVGELPQLGYLGPADGEHHPLDRLRAGGELANVKNKWLAEIRHHCPTAPVMLVDKIDLRHDSDTLAMMRDKSNHGPIMTEEVSTFAKEVSADGAVECSARTQQRLALSNKQRYLHVEVGAGLIHTGTLCCD